jgi:formylmethanofuran dehydrogenase subunit E
MAMPADEIIERLCAELEVARVELREFTEEATHPPEVELGGGNPGYSTWQAAVALRQHVEHRIELLEHAIARAEQGLYGVCELCGERIPDERLEAVPFATLCVSCAGKAAGYG